MFHRQQTTYIYFVSYSCVYSGITVVVNIVYTFVFKFQFMDTQLEICCTYNSLKLNIYKFTSLFCIYTIFVIMNIYQGLVNIMVKLNAIVGELSLIHIQMCIRDSYISAAVYFTTTQNKPLFTIQQSQLRQAMMTPYSVTCYRKFQTMLS